MLKVTTDESHIATNENMTIAVRHCSGFKQTILGNNVFFDMGSICAEVKSVTKDLIECEIQNEGWIYENQTIVLERIQRNPSLKKARWAIDDDDQINEATYNLNENDEEEDEHDDLMREDVRFILQNDIDYVIYSTY